MSRRGLTLTEPGYTPSGRLTLSERYARSQAYARKHALRLSVARLKLRQAEDRAARQADAVEAALRRSFRLRCPYCGRPEPLGAPCAPYCGANK